jgi:hypothetical protein
MMIAASKRLLSSPESFRVSSMYAKLLEARQTADRVCRSSQLQLPIVTAESSQL